MAYIKNSKENALPPATAEPSGFQERRKSARYVPVMDRGHLGWWEGEEFRATPARLLNLSAGGVALLISVPPPRESSVWVSITGLEWGGWVASHLVTTSVEGREHIVRLSFAEALAYELFKAAIWGFPGEHEPDELQESGVEPTVGTTSR